MKKEIPPSILYYITDKNTYSDILNNRFLKSNSKYVRLSSKIPRKEQLGDNCSVIRIDCDLMLEDGYDFYLSESENWLLEEVPVRYFIFGK